MEIKRARTVRIPVNNQKQTDWVDKQRFRKKLCHTQKKFKNHLSGKKERSIINKQSRILDAKVSIAISRKDEKSEK